MEFMQGMYACYICIRLNLERPMPAQDTEEAIGHIYEASYRPEHWPVALESIAALTASRSAVLLYVDQLCSQSAATWYYNIDPAAVDAYNRSELPDPDIELVAARVPVGTATATHLQFERHQDMLAYYGDYYEQWRVPYNMHYVGGAILFKDATRLVALGIHRSDAEGPWRSEQIDHLTALTPHIQRSFDIHREFTRLRGRESAMSAGLDRMVIGVILIDHLFECVYCNTTAQAILDERCVMALESGRIEICQPRDQHPFHAALVKAMHAGSENAAADASTALGLWRPDRAVQYPVLVTPTSGATAGILPGYSTAQVAVLISDPERNQPIVPEALSQAWGLTPAEARVAIAIANGYSVDEISTLNGTSRDTTKTHLRAVYQKVGVSRQTQLAKLLLTGPFRVQF